MQARPENTEAVIDRLVERSVRHAVFGGRRDFLKGVGAGAVAPALGEVFPLHAARRECSNELWGDGILSAIDCKVTLEKKGERGVITIDAKFLHYKEF